MSEPTTYVPGPQGAQIKWGSYVCYLELGGDELLMPVFGKAVLFEMHSQFGPSPISKKTLWPLKHIPRGFWDAFERWSLGGKLVAGNLCIVPEWCPKCKGYGQKVRMIGPRTGIAEPGPCEVCNGTRVTQGSPPQNS